MTVALALRPPQSLNAPAPPFDDAEALAVLEADADGHTGRVPAALVAKHILAVTQGGDFALRRAALEALVRRIMVTHQASDSWRIRAKPRGKMAPGRYTVAVTKDKQYNVLVLSWRDLSGSCDCADFSRSSLGLCKHLWWLLERGFDDEGNAVAQTLAKPLLWWHPVRPLTGLGDWVDQVTCTSDGVPTSIRQWAESKQRFADTPGKRLTLMRSLSEYIEGAQGDELRADPAVSALVAAERELLERRQQLAIPSKVLTRALSTLRRPLFRYQLEGVTRFIAAGRLLLADDMGLGKTAQAIASCHILYSTRKVTRGLIIVPSALKPQWLREWRLFTDVPAAMVDGTKEERTERYKHTTSGFLIINYEQVLKDLPDLMRLAPQVVVLDEAQRIKNWAAKTSVYVKQLQPEWRLVLSGTPLENRLTELASLMDWVDDRALEPKWRLSEWHSIRADGQHDVVGAKNLDTLRLRLKSATLRRVRKEVLSQLPPRTDTRVSVSMTEEQMAAHSEFDQPIAKLVRTAQRRPLTQPEFLRLMSLMTQQRIICNGLAQRDFEGTWPTLSQSNGPTEATLRGLFSPKLLEFRELISNLTVTQGRKVVVFSQWKRMLRLAEWAVSDIVSEAGLRAVYFTGDESQKRRTQNIVDFHDEPRYPFTGSAPRMELITRVDV